MCKERSAGVVIKDNSNKGEAYLAREGNHCGDGD